MSGEYADPPHVVAAQPGWLLVSLGHVDNPTLAEARPETVRLILNPVAAWRIDFHRRRMAELLYEHPADPGPAGTK